MIGRPICEEGISTAYSKDPGVYQIISQANISFSAGLNKQ